MSKVGTDDSNARLSAIREYMRWGKNDIDDQDKKTLESIEGDSQDTLIGHSEDEHEAAKDLLGAIVVAIAQERLLETVESSRVATRSVFSTLSRLDSVIRDTPPEVAGDLWEAQASICDAALKLRMLPALQTQFTKARDEYRQLQLRTQALTSAMTSSWGPPESKADVNPQ